MNCNQLRVYYLLKPIMPRQLQLLIRQVRARKIFSQYESPYVYPNDPWRPLNPPSGYDSVVLLTHDVETGIGCREIETLRCIERDYGVVSTWNFVLEKYPLSPEITDNLFSEGCECGAHGLSHDGKLFMSLAVYKERMKRIESIGRSLGMNGFRSPSLHRNRDWMSSMTWRWDSSFPAWDPFQPQAGGCGQYSPFKLTKHTWELPVTLLQDYTIFYELKQRDIQIWRAQIDYLIKNSGLINLIVHPDYVNSMILNCYREVIDYCTSNYSPWITTPSELCKYLDEIDG